MARLRLRRILPQHAASGAVVPVVLRAAGAVAAVCWALAEADAECAVLDGRHRHRPVHVGARRRATGGGHRLAAARTEAGGHRTWANHGPGFSLCAAAHTLS